MMNLPPEIESRISPEPNSGCWLWTGEWSPHYAKWRRQYVHRLTYVALRGPIPSGLQLDHRCRVTICVNPWHLDAVTSRENTLRGHGRTAKQARQTHCIRGHELVGSNLYVSAEGKRSCRACWKERDQLRGPRLRVAALEEGR